MFCDYELNVRTAERHIVFLITLYVIRIFAVWPSLFPLFLVGIVRVCSSTESKKDAKNVKLLFIFWITISTCICFNNSDDVSVIRERIDYLLLESGKEFILFQIDHTDRLKMLSCLVPRLPKITDTITQSLECRGYFLCCHRSQHTPANTWVRIFRSSKSATTTFLPTWRLVEDFEPYLPHYCANLSPSGNFEFSPADASAPSPVFRSGGGVGGCGLCANPRDQSELQIVSPTKARANGGVEYGYFWVNACVWYFNQK